MNFILAGLNIDHTPIELLECVSIPADSLERHLERLAVDAGGGVILSTCSRTEVYAIADDVELGLRQLTEFIGMIPGNAAPEFLGEHVYTLSGLDVATHLFSVTAGLHSVALGESQIIGQVTRALRAAGEIGTVEPAVSRLFHAALRNSRHVRREFGLGRNRISVASLGVQELQKVVGNFEGLRILLVGAGETGKVTASALRRHGADDIVVTSRSMDRSAILAAELGSGQIPFDQVSESLKSTDVLITCTAATDPVIQSEAIRAAMATRPGRPLYVLDVGMPRDVDPTASEIDNVTVITLSELRTKSAAHQELREEAATAARALIEDGVKRFTEHLIGFESESVIRTLGGRIEQMRKEEVKYTLGRLGDLTAKQSDAVERMTRSLVRRILADPISYLRSEDDSAAQAVQKAFALDAEPQNRAA